jgi:DNA repair protein RecO (recombination protein O)
VVALQLYEGRTLDIVTQAERLETLSGLRANLDSYGRATIVLDAVDQVTSDGEANPALYKLLTGALRELDGSGNVLVVPAFVAKLLALEGVQPMVDACVVCGATEDLVTLQVHDGGVACRSCRRGGQTISEGARRALSLLMRGRIREVLENTPEAVGQELEMLAARMIEQHIERRLKSSTVIYEQFNH